MACYTSRTYKERRTIQKLWEDGVQAKEIADKLEAPLSSLYSELRRGQDGSRLPNKRMRYNADLAQLRIQQSFERRGRRTGEGPAQKEVNPAQDWKYSIEDAPKPSGGLGMIDISGVRGDDEPRGRSRQPTGTVSPGGPRLNDFTKAPAVV